ncbi:MAG: cbb3-type cytochrome c oxidase subunit II, partial [Flavobacteriales bacterium]|nr:cbb3-type cytochrome c oxidase subunit II [Flavobacteriales bacterium]
QWGSKRTGPDLARVGAKYPDSWHYYHMLDPTSMSPGSLMPAYPHLFTDVLDTTSTRSKVEAMITLGVPYEKEFVDQANAHLSAQSAKIVAELKAGGIDALQDREIIAMIAYLQRIGTDIKAAPGKTANIAK